VVLDADRDAGVKFFFGRPDEVLVLHASRKLITLLFQRIRPLIVLCAYPSRLLPNRPVHALEILLTFYPIAEKRIYAFRAAGSSAFDMPYANQLEPPSAKETPASSAMTACRLRGNSVEHSVGFLVLFDRCRVVAIIRGSSSLHLLSGNLTISLNIGCICGSADGLHFARFDIIDQSVSVLDQFFSHQG
jgi:hypothetical protein